MGSAPGLLSLVSVYFEGFQPEWYTLTIYYCRDITFWSETLNWDWVRPTVWSAIWVWQPVCLSEQVRPWDTLACYRDVKRPANDKSLHAHFSICPLYFTSRFWLALSSWLRCLERKKRIANIQTLSIIFVLETISFKHLHGAGIAHWLCVGLAVLLDAASWVRSSSGENFSGRGDFSLELVWVLTSFPQVFWMGV